MRTDQTDGPFARSRRGFLTVATAVTATLAGCSGDSGGTDDGTGGGSGSDDDTDTTTTTTREIVDMTDDLEFVPESLTVSAGTTVVWENVGSAGHSVTAYEDEIPDGADYWASGGFDSESAANDGYPSQGDVGQDETYERTFETTGTHEYYCIPHEAAGMKGEIVVE